MKVGRKKGSKNTSQVPANRLIKEPYEYAALRILEQAGQDAGKKFNRKGERCEDCHDSMWEEWLETETCKEGITRANRFTIACAIGSYVEVK